MGLTLQIVSDLHLEFEEDKHGNLRSSLILPKTDADLLVFAGDTGRALRGMQWAHATCARLGIPGIYILGNHEYYKRSFERVVAELKAEAQRLGGLITVLQDESYISHNVPIFGATLWTDMELNGNKFLDTLAVQDKLRGMRDYRLIRRDGGQRKFLVQDSVAAHQLSRAKLQEFLHAHGTEAVVVTHHAPSPRSIPEKFRIGTHVPFNAAYASNLESLIARYQPRLWVHGHIHHTQNYYLGDTQIIANPRGYVQPHQPFESDFNPALTLRVK